MRNGGAAQKYGSAAEYKIMAMPEGSIQPPVTPNPQLLIPALKLFGVSLSRIVIGSVAEGSFQGNTDSIVIGFHSWIFIQSEETEDANSELFKEDVDDAMYKNPYEI